MGNNVKKTFILSGGEGSHSISMFQLDEIKEKTDSTNKGDGRLQSVFSRGKLPHDVGDVGSLAVQDGYVAVAVGGGEVLMLSLND